MKKWHALREIVVPFYRATMQAPTVEIFSAVWQLSREWLQQQPAYTAFMNYLFRSSTYFIPVPPHSCALGLAFPCTTAHRESCCGVQCIAASLRSYLDRLLATSQWKLSTAGRWLRCLMLSAKVHQQHQLLTIWIRRTPNGMFDLAGAVKPNTLWCRREPMLACFEAWRKLVVPHLTTSSSIV